MTMPSNDPFRFISLSMILIRSPRTGAADAADVHFKDFFLRIDDQVVIDADFAELVHDYGVSSAVIAGEDAIEQRRFASSEKTG